MRTKVLSIALLLGFAIAVSAQTSGNREKDHDELRALTKTVTTALNSKDYDKLASCFVDNYAFIAVDQGVIQGKGGLKDYYEGVLKNPKFGITKMKFEPKADIKTQFYGQDSGYCYGTAKNTYQFKDGMVIEMQSRWSATLTKENGKWKIVMIHAGVNFLDNPVLDKVAATAKGTMISMGIIVFILIVLIIVLLIKNKKLAKAGSGSKPTETSSPAKKPVEEEKADLATSDKEGGQ